MYALAALALLVAVRNYGVWGYLLRTPSSLNVKSIELWLSFGVWPLILAVAAWATMLGLGRRTFGAATIRTEEDLDTLAAAAVGPWLLRTWLNTGDPLWPLMRKARPKLVREGLVLHQLL